MFEKLKNHRIKQERKWLSREAGRGNFKHSTGHFKQLIFFWGFLLVKANYLLGGGMPFSSISEQKVWVYTKVAPCWSIGFPEASFQFERKRKLDPEINALFHLEWPYSRPINMRFYCHVFARVAGNIFCWSSQELWMLLNSSVVVSVQLSPFLKFSICKEMSWVSLFFRPFTWLFLSLLSSFSTFTW